MKHKKQHNYLAWLLVFAMIFSLGAIKSPKDAVAESKKATTIKSVSLEIGNKKVTKKTYQMKQGDKKRIKVSVTLKKGKKIVKFSSGNKKIVMVNKNGRVTAKKAGTAKITVTVQAKGSAAKKTWVKIKVVKPSSDEKDDMEEPSTEDQPSSQETPEEPSGTVPEPSPTETIDTVPEPAPTETPGTVPNPSSTETPATVPNPSPGTIQPPVADNPTPAPTETPNISGNRKSIVMYFSCTNNTKTIAEYVAESAEADIYRIEPSVPYTADDLNYNNANSRSITEQNDETARPAIAGNLPSVDNYEVIYVGYPIWSGQAPKIMYTFIESYDWSGKIVVPFCTSGGSGIGTSAINLQAAARGNAVWTAGQQFSGSSGKETVRQWVQGLDLLEVAVDTKPAEIPNNSSSRKNVVVYFSCTDNTKRIAEYVAESTNADIYRIEPYVPYTSEDLNYGNSDSRATKEQNDSSARPAIAGELPSLDGYENVYLGYDGSIIGLN